MLGRGAVSSCPRLLLNISKGLPRAPAIHVNDAGEPGYSAVHNMIALFYVASDQLSPLLTATIPAEPHFWNHL